MRPVRLARQLSLASTSVLKRMLAVVVESFFIFLVTDRPDRHLQAPILEINNPVRGFATFLLHRPIEWPAQQGLLRGRCFARLAAGDLVDRLTILELRAGLFRTPPMPPCGASMGKGKPLSLRSQGAVVAGKHRIGGKAATAQRLEVWFCPDEQCGIRLY